MKSLFKFISALSIILLCFTINISYAHSGRTDSNGGHKDNKNVSGLGSYHYHCGGHPAHLHTNGVCPYNSNASTQNNNNNNTLAKDMNTVTEDITISNAPAEMKIGDTSKIDYNISASKGIANAQWKTSDDNIISIKSNGTLCANKEGQATITLSTNNTSKSFDVHVSPIEVNSITLLSEDSKSELGHTTKIKATEDLKLQLGHTTKIKADISPNNSSFKDLVWTSEDNSIATVDKYGEVKGVSVGETKISATSHNNLTASANVKIYEVLPDDIKLDSEEIKLDINDTYKIQCTVLPVNSNSTNLEFKSDDTNILTVTTDGIIQPVNEGITNVTVTTSNGISKTITVKIYSKKKHQMIFLCLFTGLTSTCVGVPVWIKRKNKPKDII
ncbi:YHYH domain-containing protein [Clostridium sp. CTA-5]